MPESLDSKNIVMQFNDAITNRDINTLATRMTDDHAFVDTEGSTVSGKNACLQAWRGFFAAFPDYKNTFQSLEAKDDLVIALGNSTCSEAQLDGPAIWTARIRDGKVAEWRVYEDTASNGHELGIGVDQS